MMRNSLRTAALSTAVAALTASSALAEGTEVLGSLTIGAPTDARSIVASVGLMAGPAELQMEVPVAANVVQVLAYWEGLDKPELTQGDTDTILIDGIPITGDRIGGATNYWSNWWASAYRADVTALGLIGQGDQTLLIEGLDYTKENHGFALVVFVEDAADDTVTQARDGLDFAYGLFPAPFDTTEAVEFELEPAGLERLATLDLIVGGADPGRTSAIDVFVDDVQVLELIDVLGNSMPEMETHSLEFEIPAGASSVRVQLLSEDRGGVNSGGGLASFLWVYSGLSVSGDGGAAEFGCDPHFWLCNWWRWDPWYRSNNVTDDVQWSDRFNQTFDVSRHRSGLPNGGRLIHALYGYGNCHDWARRFLNREIAAALANADSDINYPLSVDEVIALYRDAVGAEQGPETVQTALETVYQANRLGCPW